MTPALLELLACPFCGDALTLDENARFTGDAIAYGLLRCYCCVFPIVDGIPVMMLSEESGRVTDCIADGRDDDARLVLLASDPARREAVTAFAPRASGATFRDALSVFYDAGEADYTLLRFTDPTFIVCEAVAIALASRCARLGRPLLDLCGGPGHLSRSASAATGMAAVLSDVSYWKLWLARRYMVDATSQQVCCDANKALPFRSETFALVLCSDAFHYVWEKQPLARELRRVTCADGVLALPHLHNAMQYNPSAGLPLTAAHYARLFGDLSARLFPDADLRTLTLEEEPLDLAAKWEPARLDAALSFTLVADRTEDAFRRYPRPDDHPAVGELRVNPIYAAVDSKDGLDVTIRFPSGDYESEFGECRTYLPEAAHVPQRVLAGATDSVSVHERAALLRQRVLLYLPPRYY